MATNYGDGFEQVDLPGELVDRDLSTQDLLNLANDQIQANRITIVEIRRGEELIGRWFEDNHPEILDDDQPDYADSHFEDYTKWLKELDGFELEPMFQ